LDTIYSDMGNLFTSILIQPITNLLVVFYNFLWNDLGLAIIAITLLLKIVLYPLQNQALRSQKRLQDLQPKIGELQKKYATQKELQAQELMKLYKEEKVNPFSSCLPLLVQFPILIAVYKVFASGVGSNIQSLLYSFVNNPGVLNTVSFGFIELSKPNIPITILAVIAQFFQNKMMLPKNAPLQDSNNPMASMGKQMMYILPLLTLFIGIKMPGGLTLYWLVLTVLMMLQQYIVQRGKTTGQEIILPKS